MSFLADGCTADPAIWGDWVNAIGGKRTLTKQEAFDGMIQFLQIFYDFTSSDDAKLLIHQMRSATNCNDTLVPITKQWNRFVKEVLLDPEGSRQYLEFQR